MELLAKTRKLNALLQSAAGKPVNFREMSDTMCEVIEANVFVVSRRGKLLGYAIHQQIENERMKQMLAERQFPEEYTQSLFNITETSSNLDVHRIAITVTIYDAEGRSQNFGQVGNAFVRLANEETSEEVLRFDLGEDFSIETAVVFCELYRHNGQWKFNAVGSGFQAIRSYKRT